MPNKFSIREALKFGWDGALNHVGFFVMSLLGAWVAMIIAGSLSENKDLLGALGSILSILVGALIGLGFTKTTLRMLDGGEPVLEDFRPHWPQYWQFVGATVIYMIIASAGFILLVIPGVIAVLGLQFYGYFLVDKGLRPVEALKASWTATKGQKWQLFLFLLTVIGVTILGAIALLVGLFVAVPTVLLATAYVYRKLISGQEVLPLGKETEAKPVS